MTDTDEPEETSIESELSAMRMVAVAMLDIDQAARERVLRWAGQRYGL